MDNSSFLVKYKLAGLNDDAIASRLGISKEEVEKLWAGIIRASREQVVSGYPELVKQIGLIAQQFQLSAETIKVFLNAIANVAAYEDIKKVLPSMSENDFELLHTHFIVLRPFIPKDPQVSLQESLQKRQQAN